MRTLLPLLAMALAAVAGPARAVTGQAPVTPCPKAAAVKIAFVFEGAPEAEAAHFQAASALQKQLPATACVRIFDHLAVGVDPDANARFLLGSLGLERYTAVFLLTSRHAENLAKVARQFPATTYLQLNGRAAGANLGAYRLDTAQAGRLAGQLAAHLSSSGRVAYALRSGQRPDNAWISGVRRGVARRLPDARVTQVTWLPDRLPDAPMQDSEGQEPDVVVVATRPADREAPSRTGVSSLVTWINGSPARPPGRNTLTLWTDWTPFYRGVAECALAGKHLEPSQWRLGAASGVITGTPAVLHSAAWNAAGGRRGRALALCPAA